MNSRPILHVVDEATRYQAARCIKTISTDANWYALRKCWIDDSGLHESITYDAGKQFMVRVLQSISEKMHIQTKSDPIEFPNYVSFVEQYHVPVRRACKII